MLAPYCPDEEDDDAEKESIALPALLDYFASMKDALEDLDMDQMETVIKEMNHYSYEGWQQEMFAKLKEAVEEIDVDSCEDILRDWGNKLS